MTAAAEPAVSRPRLAQGSRLRWDEARQSWVVLAPERVILLDEIAHEIVRRFDGTRTFGDVVTDLVETFEADPDEVEADVAKLLNELLTKRVMMP